MTTPLDIKSFKNEELTNEILRRMGNKNQAATPIQVIIKKDIKNDIKNDIKLKEEMDKKWEVYGHSLENSKTKPFNNVFEKSEKERIQDMLDGFRLYGQYGGSQDERLCCYGKSTTRGEVGIKMLPVREGFKTSDSAAQAEMKRRRANYLRTGKGPKYLYADDIRRGQMPYGRGKIQVTWWFNISRLKDAMKRDLNYIMPQDPMVNPDILLNEEVSNMVLFYGLESGFFNGAKKGFFYYADQRTKEIGEYKAAMEMRKLVNGSNKAAQFADWYFDFLEATRVSGILA